ncbi:hypothetical protein EIP86_008798 [Pleurotus ostreatoroseus]|nr:hypothetical protein EIP86_008798 [Pleurotus ostreatoroseus]
MTRYTNVGIKRTYVEAGFDNAQEVAVDSSSHAYQRAPGVDSTLAQDVDVTSGLEKKKRRRRKPVKTSGTEDNTPQANPSTEATSSKIASKGNQKRRTKGNPKDARKFASERRRLQRQRERNMNTTCFACREKGHAAKDCPKAISSDAIGTDQKIGKQAVGLCYRCGSRKHTLSRCKKPVDPENPLPFSSCFVCSAMGHLASSCPQNKSKGIYPNGGCCKLCGETTHLAKDCTLRKNDVSAKAVFLGIGQEAGADEDDFHTFKRKTAEVVREEKADERRKKKADVRVAAHSGVVKSFGQAVQQPKKVVTF